MHTRFVPLAVAIFGTVIASHPALAEDERPALGMFVQNSGSYYNGIGVVDLGAGADFALAQGAFARVWGTVGQQTPSSANEAWVYAGAGLSPEAVKFYGFAGVGAINQQLVYGVGAGAEFYNFAAEIFTRGVVGDTPTELGARIVSRMPIGNEFLDVTTGERTRLCQLPGEAPAEGVRYAFNWNGPYTGTSVRTLADGVGTESGLSYDFGYLYSECGGPFLFGLEADIPVSSGGGIFNLSDFSIEGRLGLIMPLNDDINASDKGLFEPTFFLQPFIARSVSALFYGLTFGFESPLSDRVTGHVEAGYRGQFGSPNGAVIASGGVHYYYLD